MRLVPSLSACRRRLLRLLPLLRLNHSLNHSLPRLRSLSR